MLTVSASPATYNPVRGSTLCATTGTENLPKFHDPGVHGGRAGCSFRESELPAFRVRKDWPHKHLYVKMRASYDAGRFFALAPVDSSTEWKKSQDVQDPRRRPEMMLEENGP